MNVGDVIPGIDHASQQSDRWLFLALLFIGAIAVLFLWRWMVTDREKTSERLLIITDRHIAQAEHLATVVVNNTTAMVNVEKAMSKVEAVLENCRSNK